MISSLEPEVLNPFFVSQGWCPGVKDLESGPTGLDFHFPDVQYTPPKALSNPNPTQEDLRRRSQDLATRKLPAIQVMQFTRHNYSLSSLLRKKVNFFQLQIDRFGIDIYALSMTTVYAFERLGRVERIPQLRLGSNAYAYA